MVTEREKYYRFVLVLLNDEAFAQKSWDNTIVRTLLEMGINDRPFPYYGKTYLKKACGDDSRPPQWPLKEPDDAP